MATAFAVDAQTAEANGVQDASPVVPDAAVARDTADAQIAGVARARDMALNPPEPREVERL